jgi:hypothetical protein
MKINDAAFLIFIMNRSNTTDLRRACRGFLSVALFATGAVHAQVLSNGTGGGSWGAATTWTGGAVPLNGQAWTIQSGDTVVVGSGVSYSSFGTQNESVIGTLNVGAGASLQVNRLNNTATTGSGVINVAGGAFTAARLAGGASMTINLATGGTLTVTDSTAITAGTNPAAPLEGPNPGLDAGLRYSGE